MPVAFRRVTSPPALRASSTRTSGKPSRYGSSSTRRAAVDCACCLPRAMPGLASRERRSPNADKNPAVAYELKLPDLGEGLTEGEIARWLVSEGQEVAEDDPLVEIQTDKTTVEIPSPAAGTVARILVDEGKVVPVGTVLIVIGGEPDGDQPRAEEPPAPPSETKVRATPLVRRIANELGVDLASVEGTGPQGRVTEDDVRRAADGAGAPAEGRREPLRGVRR